MKHRDGDDEGQEEPVRDVDMLFLPVEDRPEIDGKKCHPDERQPDVNVPFWFGVLLGLRGAEEITGRRQDNEQVVAPEHEPGEIASPKPCGRGALDDVEAGHDQRVAAECENDCTGVQWAKPAEVRKGLAPVEVQDRKGQLKRDKDPDEEACNAPKSGGGLI